MWILEWRQNEWIEKNAYWIDIDNIAPKGIVVERALEMTVAFLLTNANNVSPYDKQFCFYLKLCCRKTRSFFKPNSKSRKCFVHYVVKHQKIAANLDVFESAVTGEWKGFEASFDPETGNAVQVPLTSLPDAFVEWNVKPTGYESYNSMVIRNNQLYRRHSRILPSVSFDADTIDLETEVYFYDLNEEGFVFLADGSYSKGPVSLQQEQTAKPYDSFEFCLCVLSDSNAPTRYLFRFPVDIKRKQLWGDVQVFLEYRDGEFCDGNAISSGSGYMEGFSSDVPLPESLLNGKWYPQSVQFLQGISSFHDSRTLYDVDYSPFVVDNNFKPLPRHVLMLPGNIYVKCDSDTFGQGLNVQVGHVTLEGRWISFHRKYMDNRLVATYRMVCSKE
ncbi:hypothetical protein GpartN1_g2768.t1 [Galdieria partita]|uniref:Uncharacterized protein n=1 Tax=Galdieria partita TaxID=83374 RepID=A0A9C7PWJ7_9RHOD|nr:hypothetical protein GpartN1_g2768.t1 [Galdieria partita]